MAGRSEIVVRFAGEGGQGVLTAAEMMARAASRGGFHGLTFATFPSQITGLRRPARNQAPTVAGSFPERVTAYRIAPRSRNEAAQVTI